MHFDQDTPSHRFLRFAGSSLLCTAVDQGIAWLLFALLRMPLAGADLLRIALSSVMARTCAVSLNFTINRRVVFGDGTHEATQIRTRESLIRFITLSATILLMSTLGVWLAHTQLGVPEWQAKPVVDLALFFANYNGQRMWVFRPRPQEVALA